MIGTFLSFIAVLLLVIGWRFGGWWLVGFAILAVGLSLYAFFEYAGERDGNWPMFLCIMFVWLSVAVGLFLKLYM